MKKWQKGLTLIMVIMTFYAIGCATGTNSRVEAQAAAGEVLPPDQDRYLLGPEDVIEVSVWKEPDMTKQLSSPTGWEDFLPIDWGNTCCRQNR